MFFYGVWTLLICYTNVAHIFATNRVTKLQSKVKELSRDVRNKEEEIEDQRRTIDSLKQEKRKGEKSINEVRFK